MQVPNVNSLNQMISSAKTDAEKYQAARKFEAYFVGMIFEKAQSGIEKSGLFSESENGDVFQQMMMQTLSENIAKTPKGLGLAEQMIGKRSMSVAEMQNMGVVQRPEAWSSNTTQNFSLSQPLQGRVSSTFGLREDPINGTEKMHDGLDIAASAGSPILAAQDGEVVFSGKRGGYGNAVMIKHNDQYTTLYGHAQELTVRVGQKVKKGDTIAKVGSTGRSTGPHLHFELRKDGQAINPENLFEKKI